MIDFIKGLIPNSFLLLAVVLSYTVQALVYIPNAIAKTLTTTGIHLHILFGTKIGRSLKDTMKAMEALKDLEKAMENLDKKPTKKRSTSSSKIYDILSKQEKEDL